METVASRSAAGFGLLFGVQTFPVMLGQVSLLQPTWFWAYNIAIFGGLLLAVVASIVRRFVRTVNAWVAFSYLVAMATWPLAHVGGGNTSLERPWLWFMCTVATAAAVIAFSPWVATTYLFAAPMLYGVIRVSPSGGEAPWELAALDAIYATLLGGVILVILTMLRGAAASVDAAQSTAIARYSHAVRQHATEVERVRVDSIVHDSVLTTLISAARAFSPEAMALSATMANNAIGHLRVAAAAVPDDESRVGVEQVAERIAEASRTLSATFSTRVTDIGAGALNGQVAEALYSAAVQAMVNSVQHASRGKAVERWLHITGVGADGLDIEIGDNGVGFTVEEVPAERLGLRVSITDRVTNAGGSVHIVSSRDQGAVVSIRWPSPDSPDAEVSE